LLAKLNGFLCVGVQLCVLDGGCHPPRQLLGNGDINLRVPAVPPQVCDSDKFVLLMQTHDTFER
jgi:hypothetical protein